MLDPFLEKQIGTAKDAFKEARCENIILLCEEYLLMLNKFRSELYKFQGSDDINLQQSNFALYEKALAKRREIHLALTHTVQELNQTKALLDWLTSVNGYEIIETFNRLQYKDRENWECRGGKIRFHDGLDPDQLSIQEAAVIAVRLRCEEFINSPDVEGRRIINPKRPDSSF